MIKERMLGGRIAKAKKGIPTVGSKPFGRTFNKETGKWNFNSAIQFVSPGFENNDMGLNFRADNINKHISFGYKWLEPGKVFQMASLNTAYMTNHNFAGDKLSEMLILMGFAKRVVFGFQPLFHRSDL